MSHVAEDLEAAELILSGGTWGGVLFDNPTIGDEPSLHWTFTFEFEEVRREYGTTPCHLAVDWVRLPAADWQSMAPMTVTCDGFGAPVESSLYFFDHFRFDSVALTIGAQRGHQLYVSADVAGDVDDLGLGGLHAEGWLDFDGMIVALSDQPPTVDAAVQRLAAFTSVDGLAGVHTGHNFRFTPTTGPRRTT